VVSAIKINTPTGVNDFVAFGGSFGIGDTSATFGPSNTVVTSYAIYGGSGTRYGSVAFTPEFDSIYNTSVIAGALNPTGAAIGPSGQQLTRSYGGWGTFEHGWNAEWRSSIYGGVGVVDYNQTANAILCSNFRVGAAAGTLSNFNSTCNMDYRIAYVGGRTTWAPVRDLLIGVEVTWSNHHSGNNGAVYAQPTVNNFKPAALYEVRDQNVVGGMFSVRRFF